MMHKRTSTAVWRGSGPKGTGALSTQSGALENQPYSSDARFVSEDGKMGTNPEELIGAAHAGCFTLSVAYRLTSIGVEATELKTVASVSLEKGQAGWSITGIHLALEGKAPGIDQAKFDELAKVAKEGCPVSRALASVPITMSAKLL